MNRKDREQRVILIGGTSHSGKSTLAESLGSHLGWACVSTDKMARHPGRPWSVDSHPVPEHVADHYLSLSVDDLMTDVLRHYRSMWPDIERLITKHAASDDAEGLILEGSALWPETVATLELENVSALWLTTSEDRLIARIHAESNYERGDDRQKALIDKFVQRTLAYNRQMTEAVGRLELTSLTIDESADPEAICRDLL